MASSSESLYRVPVPHLCSAEERFMPVFCSFNQRFQWSATATRVVGSILGGIPGL